MRAVVALALLALACAASAQTYRWTDKNGKVVYGDAPPPGVKATPLRAPPAAAAADAAKDKEPPLTPEQAFQKRRLEAAKKEEEATKSASDARQARENCDSSQASLRQLESGQRVAKTGADGERVFIDDAERAQQAERTRQLVAQWCK